MNADFHINGTVLTTERLTLRAFTWDDLHDLYAYASVPGVGEMAGWKHHESIDTSRSVLTDFIREDEVFAVCLRTDGRVVGTVGVDTYGREDALTEFDGYLGRELGFVLAKDCWGQGLMPEAVSAVTDYLFRELDYDFLLCGHYDFNRQSRRVQEKCGFRPYRRLLMTTRSGEQQPGVLNLLINPVRPIRFTFSHPETLVWREDGREPTHGADTAAPQDTVG